MGDSRQEKMQMQNGSKETPASGVPEKIKDLKINALSAVDGVMQKGQGMMDAMIPPDRREDLLAKLKAFVLANPKLSAFLCMNLALTGLPVVLFIFFALSVFVSALLVGIMIGLLGALAFTVFAVGTALLVVFPIVFFTTAAACCLFFWGLLGYYALRWVKPGVQKESKPAPYGRAADDSRKSMAIDQPEETIVNTLSRTTEIDLASEQLNEKHQ